MDVNGRAAVALEHVSKCFGALEVLRELSVSAYDGDVIAMIGSSGSGKSTFLRCINMLEVPDSGIVKVAGETIALSGPPPHRRVSDEAQLRRIRKPPAGVGLRRRRGVHDATMCDVNESCVAE